MQALEDQNEQFTLAHSMSSVLSQLISKEDFPSLIEGVLDGLVDYQVPSARGACVILYGLVSTRGSDLAGNHFITM